jgi:glycosyltransferase involved in cell wall biosynthesis
VSTGLAGPGPEIRIVLDVRPLQEPQRAPVTAAYLDALIGAYAADPVPGETFVTWGRVDLPDPMGRFPGLAVAGQRMLPPARLLSSATPAGDPLLLSGAAFASGWGLRSRGPVRGVFHGAGFALPLSGGLPLVATVLDLAPWRLPDQFQRTAGARFGALIRRRVLRRAAAVIVGSAAVGRAARQLLRVPEERVHVVGCAPRPAVIGLPEDASAGRSLAVHHGLGERYLAYAGRFDARHDLGTLLRALGSLASSTRPSELVAYAGWPPRVAVVGASPEDRAAIARAASRSGVGDLVAYLPGLPDRAVAAVVAGARAVLVPALTDAAGLAAIDGLGLGVPVIATAVDGLPEIVGEAGLIVPVREPARLATAIAAAYSDDALHHVIAEKARESPVRTRRWADVARETRTIYATVIDPVTAPRP